MGIFDLFRKNNKPMENEQIKPSESKLKVLHFYSPSKVSDDEFARLSNDPPSVPVEHIDLNKREDLDDKYNIRSWPTLVLIDEQGNAIKEFRGQVSGSMINNYIAENMNINSKENDSKIKDFFYTITGAGCLGSTCLGCLGAIIVPILLSFLVALWFCRIQPDVTYTWYSGIWHGIFIIPNWIMSLFSDSILCKAENYTTGYNIWWWIMLVIEILSILFGGSGTRRN